MRAKALLLLALLMGVSLLGFVPHSFALSYSVTLKNAYPVGTCNSGTSPWEYTNGTSLYKVAGSTSGTAVNVPSGNFTFPIVGSGTSTSQCSASPLTYGLVGYWPLDEGTGNYAYDVSGHNQTGTLENSPTWESGASCKFGDCLNFSSASSQRVTTNLKPTSAGTISLWAYPISGYGDYRVPAGWKTTSNGASGYLLIDTGRGSWRGVISPSGSLEDSITGTTITNNQWVYLTFTWSNGAIVFYENGVSQGTNTYSDSFNSTLLATDLSIADASTQGNLFDGRIEDVRIYDTALSSSQVLALYDNPPSGITIEHQVTTSATFTTNFYQQYPVYNPSAYSISGHNIGTTYATTNSGIWLDGSNFTAFGLTFPLSFSGYLYKESTHGFGIYSNISTVTNIRLNTSVNQLIWSAGGASRNEVVLITNYGVLGTSGNTYTVNKQTCYFNDSGSEPYVLLSYAKAGIVFSAPGMSADSTSPFQLYYSAIGATGIQIAQYNTFIKIPSGSGISPTSYTIYPSYIYLQGATITGGSGAQTFGLGEQYGNLSFSTPWTGTDVYVTAGIQSGQTNAYIFWYNQSLATITINGQVFNSPFSSSAPRGGSSAQVYQTNAFTEVQIFTTSTIDFGEQAAPTPNPNNNGGGSGSSGSSGTVVVTKTINGTVITSTSTINPTGQPFSSNAVSFATGSIVLIIVLIAAFGYWARAHPRAARKLTLGDTKLPSLDLGNGKKKKRRRLRL